MATVNHALNAEDSDRRNKLYLWETVTDTNNTGQALRITGNVSDIIVQAVGTFASATVTMQGSLDNTNWVTLKDPGGSDITFTAAGGNAVRDKWRYIRPTTASGTGTQDIDIYLQVTAGP